ncbi:MAG TPA: hypothetical protein VHS03_06290 [Gaiellaceae bacterium]|nr:hypothetical protein [Gaiellaceae bacterium]
MRAIAGMLVVLAALAVARSAPAAPTTYGVAGTKACLAKKGVQLQSGSTGSLGGLTAAQKSESLIGTLPVGSAPNILYLAIGHDAPGAVALRAVLKKGIVPNPTAGNSWSGQKSNAAWIVVSLGGAPPPAAAHTLVLSCLTRGTTPPTGKPTSPARYSRDQVALCLGATNKASVLSAQDIASVGSLVLGKIPPRFVPHLIFAYTSTQPNTKDGFGILMLFGSSHADALALRAQLNSALGGKLLGPSALWLDSKKNVAWASFRIHGTTTQGIASGKRLVLGCLP